MKRTIINKRAAKKVGLSEKVIKDSIDKLKQKSAIMDFCIDLVHDYDEKFEKSDFCYDLLTEINSRLGTRKYYHEKLKEMKQELEYGHPTKREIYADYSEWKRKEEITRGTGRIFK